MKKQSFFQKFREILPSKKFTIIVGTGVGIIALVFGVFSLFGNEENFASKKNRLAAGNKTITELVQADTDGDSIPDWEESLWGTNKHSRMTYEGIPDVVYIENKKKELNLEEKIDEDTATETDKFAREFFSAYAAMKAEGVDDLTINNFGSALGQKMSDPQLLDKYTEKDIQAEPEDTDESRLFYYLTIAEIFEEHKKSGMGDELSIASGGIVAYEQSQSMDNGELLIIADAYAMFAAEVMATPVPESLKEYHLQIANSANNTGVSVENMAKMVDDPVVGLTGLSQYQKYSEALVTAVSDLEDVL